MSSKDTFYNINVISPGQITREHYQNVGSSAFELGFVKRGFKGSTDFEVWTAPTGGTQLTETTDYVISGVDSELTGLAGYNVYTTLQIVNATYQTGDIYVTYKVVASSVDAKYHEGISQEGLFRNAIVDPGFLLWDDATSFTNPTNGAYGPNMWKMGRSGTTPDQYILSRSTFVENEYGPYSCKIQITTPGNSDAFSEVRQEIDNFEKLRGKTVNIRFRVYVPSGVRCQMIIVDTPGSTSKIFTGIGAWQDVVIENYTVDSSASQIIGYFRFSLGGEVSTAGDYYISNFQISVNGKTLPFEQKKEADVRAQANYYYEILMNSFFRRLRTVTVTANDLYFTYKFAPKRIPGTVSIGGVENTDWNVRNLGGSAITSFTVGNFQPSKNGIVEFRATKSSHGLSEAVFTFNGSANSYMKWDARL